MESLHSLKKPTALLFTALLCASAFALLYRLGAEPLQDYDEAIYAQVISDTQHAGDFLTPVSANAPWFQKPPLYFWLAMGSEQVFGNNEFALRLPSALLGLVAIILTYLIALELSGSASVALVAGIILLTTGSFIEAARQLRLDAPVTAAILFALYSFVRAKRSPRWYMGVAVGIAVGVMFKSVIGFLAVPIILIWAFCEWDFSWLRNKFLWYGVGLSLIIVLPWHLYEWAKFGPAFWNEYLFHQVLARFGTDVNGNNQFTNVAGAPSPSWQLIKHTFQYSFPWVLVCIAGCWYLVTRRRPYAPVARQLGALAASIIVIFGIFLAAQTKLFYYVIPAFPLLALFCALYAREVYRWWKERNWSELFYLVAVPVFALALGNTIYVAFHFQSDFANNAQIVNDEHWIGVALAQHPQPAEVKTFEYLYWDTIKYYSGGRAVSLMSFNDVATTSFYMIIETVPYESNPFPPLVMQHLTPVWQGDDLTLVEFNP